jgi:hypothetical protein
MRLMANLGLGANQNGWPNVVEAELICSRQGTNAPSGPTDGDFSSIKKPFIENQASPAAGATNATVSGNSLLIQASGFNIKEAWTSGHTYTTGDGVSTPGDFVTSSGNVWVCTTSGTASGSAPSGTGTGVGTGAKFDCVGVGTGVVTVTWTGFIWAFTQG